MSPPCGPCRDFYLSILSILASLADKFDKGRSVYIYYSHGTSYYNSGKTLVLLEGELEGFYTLCSAAHSEPHQFKLAQSVQIMRRFASETRDQATYEHKQASEPT